MTRCDGYVMFLCFVCWGRFLGFFGGPDSGGKMDCGSNFPRLSVFLCIVSVFGTVNDYFSKNTKGTQKQANITHQLTPQPSP